MQLFWVSCRYRDWSALRCLFRSCFPEVTEQELSYQLRNYRREIRLVYQREGDGQAQKLLGFTIGILGKEPGLAWLEQIGVCQTVRGQGIAELLLADFERTAVQSWGASKVALAVNHANSRAIRLYHKNGYHLCTSGSEGLDLSVTLAPNLSGLGFYKILSDAPLDPVPVRRKFILELGGPLVAKVIERCLYSFWVFTSVLRETQKTRKNS